MPARRRCTFLTRGSPRVVRLTLPAGGLGGLIVHGTGSKIDGLDGNGFIFASKSNRPPLARSASNNKAPDTIELASPCQSTDKDQRTIPHKRRAAGSRERCHGHDSVATRSKMRCNRRGTVTFFRTEVYVRTSGAAVESAKASCPSSCEAGSPAASAKRGPPRSAESVQARPRSA